MESSRKLNEKLGGYLEGDKCKLCPKGKGVIKHKRNLPPHMRDFHPGEYSNAKREVEEEAQSQRTLPVGQGRFPSNGET